MSDHDGYCDDYCEECYEEGYDDGWNARNRSSRKTSDVQHGASSDGCYIATAVYGAYDCPEVWTLRRFRDQCLRKTSLGRAFVKCYYAISPSLVRRFGEVGFFQRVTRKALDPFVLKLNVRGFENTPYDDVSAR